MRDLRPAVGVALLVSAALLVTLGFVARSPREVLMVLGAFALGLFAAWLIEWSHRRRRHLRQQRLSPARGIRRTSG